MKKFHSMKILRYAKKMKAIDYLGGKCLCGNDKWYNLEFHHTHDKEYEVSRLINANYRWSIIEKELDRCIILCGNCHQEHHYIERNSNDNRQLSKRVYLEYKGNKCEDCGYDECQASLTFHHKDPKEKEIKFSDISERISNMDELKMNIIKELDKCELLCYNCHSIRHIDIDFFNENKDDILEKSNNMKELRKPINVEKVMELYNSGKKQFEICKMMNASKGAISGIIKKQRIKLTKSL